MKAGLGVPAPSEGRAAVLARLAASQAGSSLWMRREQSLQLQALASASTSSPRSSSPLAPHSSPLAPPSSPQGVLSPPEAILSPPKGRMSPPDDGKPPSPVAAAVEEDKVTRMTGRLETLKMGEQADAAPVVRKGTAGAAIKLSANYIRLELAEDRSMWEYKVRFAPPVDSKDERHKLIQQHRWVGPPRPAAQGPSRAHQDLRQDVSLPPGEDGHRRDQPRLRPLADVFFLQVSATLFLLLRTAWP